MQNTDNISKQPSLEKSKRFLFPEDISYSAALDCFEGIRRVFNSDYFKAHQEEILKNFIDSSSFGQLQSKIWLVETLKKINLQPLGTGFLCAGWYGLLAFFLLREKSLSFSRIFLFETDPLSVKVSEDFNRKFVKDGWRFKATVKNILNVDYSKGTFKTLKDTGETQVLAFPPDTIINTSCEHIENFDLWWSRIPLGKIVVLQSNDYKGIADHVNCVSSLEDFKKTGPHELSSLRRDFRPGYLQKIYAYWL